MTEPSRKGADAEPHAASCFRGELRRLVDSSLATADEGAWVLARDAYPTLKVDHYRDRLDAIADRVAHVLSRGSTLRDQVDALRVEVYDAAGLRGNVAAYHDPRNSYLNDVLDRGLGIPISLAVATMGIARRAGVVVEGVTFPGHFLVRLGGPGGPYADPFDRLKVLSERAMEELARRALGGDAQLRASHLEPATTRAILVRMLGNLQAVHTRRRDHARALQVCDRLVELDAGLPALRDRGLHALALGNVGSARSDLQSYLSAAKDPPDRAKIEAALERSRPARWN
jgi:regulator of sirC expression with transglutaminase-like and TPR domain